MDNYDISPFPLSSIGKIILTTCVTLLAITSGCDLLSHDLVEITENLQVSDESSEIFEEPESIVCILTEEMPMPVGGMSAFYQHIARHLKYPAMVPEPVGKVFVQFTVNIDSTITDLKIIMGLEKPYNDNAIEVIKSGPKWIPGKQRGKAVRVRMVIPMSFHFK